MGDTNHTYHYSIDMRLDSAPAAVLAMVAPGSRVLEIGAGPGSITRRLIADKGCDVTALEVEETALAILKQVCDKVVAADLNAEGWSDALRADHGLFDYVIAADVLEHVYDPARVLSGMQALLKPQGSVILSLPHVGHCAVLACLMDEDFEYRDWGLLDRTHVRFFGIKNIDRLYRAQGMAVEEARFIVRTPEMTEFAHRWHRMPRDVQRALRANPFADVYQVVTRARPAALVAAPVVLTDQPVPRPNLILRDYWATVMSTVRPLRPIDPRSPIRGWTPPAPKGKKRLLGLRKMAAKVALRLIG